MLISSTYNCADANICTDNELTLQQWASGNVTSRTDPTLSASSFMGKKDKCITKAWDANNYSCPEYINYAPNGFVFSDIVAPGLVFNKDKAINIDEDVTASIITSFIMNNAKSDTNNAMFKSIY